MGFALGCGFEVFAQGALECEIECVLHLLPLVARSSRVSMKRMKHAGAMTAQNMTSAPVIGSPCCHIARAPPMIVVLD